MSSSTLIGIFLFVIGLLLTRLSLSRIYLITRANTDQSHVGNGERLSMLIQAAGRSLMPICGLLLFFHGWRLGEELQIAVLVLSAGLLVPVILRGALVPVWGSILIYQGWRLDPSLRNAFVLLVLINISEAMPRLFSEYSRERGRSSLIPSGSKPRIGEDSADE